jgi:hypothetical protein
MNTHCAGNIRFQNARIEWDGISEKDKGIEPLCKNDINDCISNSRLGVS